MNRRWCFYDPVTGLFSRKKYEGPDDTIERNTPTGMIAIEGDYDTLTERVYVEIGIVVPHDPTPPDSDHELQAIFPDGKDRASQRWRWVKKPEVAQREEDERRARRFIADLQAAERVMDRLSPTERATLQRFRPSGPSSDPAPTAFVEPPEE